MNSLLALTKKILPLPLKNILRRIRDFYQWDSFYQKSWSQEGEDLILSRFFGAKTNGFYVDVGAHHPLRFSNTYKLYKQGWRGINVDAMPGCMKLFNRLRKRDISLEIPITKESQKLTYYIFNEPALNTFSKELADERVLHNNYSIIKTISLDTKPLYEILDQYLPLNQEIDFMSVDVEGMDMGVLASNNWNKYRPAIVLVEQLKGSLNSHKDNDVFVDFMQKCKYSLLAKTFNTVFYIAQEKE